MTRSTDSGHGLLAALRRLAATISFGLCKLNEIEFSAPWKPAGAPCRRGGL